jgi:hypothetical protein
MKNHRTTHSFAEVRFRAAFVCMVIPNRLAVVQYVLGWPW